MKFFKIKYEQIMNGPVLITLSGLDKTACEEILRTILEDDGLILCVSLMYSGGGIGRVSGFPFFCLYFTIVHPHAGRTIMGLIVRTGWRYRMV